MLEVVKTKNGFVKGYPGNNQFVSVFKGIPFAKPPINELRWKPTEKVENWDGVRECFEYPNIAWQPRFSSEGGSLAATEFYVRDYNRSEDCLYLNVFTPAKTEDDKLPVVIYVHGGAYETGYSYLNAYDGEIFAKNGIVYVSIQYRVNVFGFLITSDTKDEYGAGNFGLLDQIQALKWIKENIEAFGGDSQNITLMGQSAGGSSVENLIHSHLSNDIMKRVIMQSGGGLNKKGPMDCMDKSAAIRIGDNFLKFIGVSSVEEARKFEAELINEKYIEFRKTINSGIVFSPVMDGKVLQNSANEYFRAGQHKDMEILVGSTADEFRQKRSLSYEEKINILSDRFDDEDTRKKYIEFLTKNVEIDDLYFENRIGDEMTSGGLAFAENELKLGRKPTYVYYFTYVPPGAEHLGAHHSVEHHFVFGTLKRSYRDYGVKDYEKSLILSNAWINFVKTGNPSSKYIDWKPYESGLNNVMVIGDEIRQEKIEVNKNVEFLINYALNS